LAASARYIIPVLKNLYPSFEAASLPTEDLPDPAGPSNAMITGLQVFFISL
jgi:hypothetical protein